MEKSGTTGANADSRSAARSHPIYAGQFRHALDSKHRITIPSGWRPDTPQDLFLVPDPAQRCLLAMPPDEFQSVKQRVAANPAISPHDQRTFIRRFYSHAHLANTDRQGRLLLPEDHCRQLRLDGEVVLVGVHERFEIWSPESWDQFTSSSDDLYRRIADLAGL